MDIDKLEPSTLNHEAREELLDLITKRMSAMNHCIVNRLKYALDKAEFARTHTLTEPMGQTVRFLKDASRLVSHSLVDLERDMMEIDRAVKMAEKIRESEEVE